MASTISKQPEFATKFQDISVDATSYAPGTIDVGVAGRFGEVTSLDSDGQPVTSNKAVAIFVGTGGTLTFLQEGRDRDIPGNYTTLKNIPNGSFLPIIATRILISDLNHIHRFTRLVVISANDVIGLASVSAGTNESKVATTTSGSGTGLEVNIHVYNDDNGVRQAALVVSSRTHEDYAVGQTITVASGWDGGSAPALTHTLTAANVGTVPATTADDIQIYF